MTEDETNVHKNRVQKYILFLFLFIVKVILNNCFPLPPWYIQLIVAIGALWIIFNKSVEGPVRASNATVNAYQGVASNRIIGQLDF